MLETKLFRSESSATEPNERNEGISKAESMFAFTAALAATLATRELIKFSWRKTLHRDPPKNPASSEVAWKEALAWGTASGAMVGLVRIASRRLSTGVIRKIRS